MRGKVPLKFLIFYIIAIVAIFAGLTLIFTFLPINATPTMLASLIMISFLAGAVGFNWYQERSNKRRRKKGMQQMRRDIGLEEESEDFRYLRRR